MTTGGVTLRSAAPADEAVWRGLWDEYLAFYEVTLDPAVTDRTWARILDPLSPLTARLAEVEGRVVGFALHHWHLSTWGMGADGYLEDLFLSPGARGRGLGRLLIEDLIAIGRAAGWSRLYWMTDEGNAQARALYDRFALADGHVRYRLTLSGNTSGTGGRWRG